MNKKGFTLIELIVIIAVLGILVLLAVPKFLGYTEKAKITQIKNDSKAHESFIETQLIENPDFTLSWSSVPKSTMKSHRDSGKLYSKKGLVTSSENFDSSYSKIPKLKGVKSHLPGDFIWSEDKVYYVEKTETETIVPPAPNTVSSCFNYQEEGEGLVVTGYKCQEKNIAIPENHEGLPVVGIGNYALFNKNNPAIEELGDESGTIGSDVLLESVFIPGNIEKIGVMAFGYQSQMKTIHLSEGIKELEMFSLGLTGLESIKLPDSVTSVGQYAFAYNIHLKEFKIGSGVKDFSTGSLMYSVSLKSLTIPSTVEVVSGFLSFSGISDLTIEEGVKRVSEYSFYCIGNGDCMAQDLSEIEAVLPENIQEILNKLKEIKPGILTIPSTSVIGDGAIQESIFDKIIIADVSRVEPYGLSATQTNSLIIEGATGDIKEHALAFISVINNMEVYPDIDTIREGAFYKMNQDSINKLNVTFHGNIGTIGRESFVYSEFDKMQFKGSLSKIGYGAFDDSKIGEIELPSTLSHIGDSAFRGVHFGKKTLNIPNSVSLIEKQAFDSSNLEEIVFDSGTELQTVGKWAFEAKIGHSIKVKAPFSKESIINKEYHYGIVFEGF